MSGYWITDDEGDRRRVSTAIKWLDKAAIREKYGVYNRDILGWVMEGLVCKTSGNTRFADSIIVSVNADVLAAFLQKKHPEIMAKEDVT